MLSYLPPASARITRGYRGAFTESLKELLKLSKLDIVAAGGVTTIEDVKKLKYLGKDGLKGMIIGKALYEKRIDLAEAIKICSLNA